MSYLFLFQASTWFTELITAAKYPDYADYQENVGRFLPRLSLPEPPHDDDLPPAQAKVEKKTAGSGITSRKAAKK
jgi:hypothetical protein